MSCGLNDLTPYSMGCGRRHYFGYVPVLRTLTHNRRKNSVGFAVCFICSQAVGLLGAGGVFCRGWPDCCFL